MSIDLDKLGQERGCDSDGAEHPGDASAQGAYRARRNDTHLTHGCIALFRRSLRVRSGCAWYARRCNHAFPGHFEGAIRTLAGGRP
jgi:hypothetical protein